MMNTPPHDEFVPPGVDGPSWLAFETRMQHRRFVSLLQNVESCIGRGDIAGARAALEEARTLRPEAPELARLEARLANQPVVVARRDLRVWGRVLAGTSMLLAGVGLMFVAESSQRAGTARALSHDAAARPNSASQTSLTTENEHARADDAPVVDLPARSRSRVNAPAVPSPRSAQTARARESHTVALAQPSRKPAALTPARRARDVADSPTSPAAALSAPLITLGVTTATATEGSPVSLTVTLTIPAGSAAPRVTVDWGDGITQDIGVVQTARTVTHSYASAGAYNITATATPPGEPSATSRPAPSLIVSAEARQDTALVS